MCTLYYHTNKRTWHVQCRPPFGAAVSVWKTTSRMEKRNDGFPSFNRILLQFGTVEHAIRELLDTMREVTGQPANTILQVCSLQLFCAWHVGLQRRPCSRRTQASAQHHSLGLQSLRFVLHLACGCTGCGLSFGRWQGGQAHAVRPFLLPPCLSRAHASLTCRHSGTPHLICSAAFRLPCA